MSVCGDPVAYARALTELDREDFRAIRGRAADDARTEARGGDADQRRGEERRQFVQVRAEGNIQHDHLRTLFQRFLHDRAPQVSVGAADGQGLVLQCHKGELPVYTQAEPRFPGGRA